MLPLTWPFFNSFFIGGVEHLKSDVNSTKVTEMLLNLGHSLKNKNKQQKHVHYTALKEVYPLQVHPFKHDENAIAFDLWSIVLPNMFFHGHWNFHEA